MFGKVFATMFTGSMVGSGPVVFSVMTYVIAHTRDGVVELNPPVIAALIGCKVGEVKHAIGKLCEPDPQSRTPDEQGRRLIHEGAFIYRVVTFEKYRNLRDDNDRREYMRKYMRDRRAEEAAAEALLTPVNSRKPPLAKAETEAEAETETSSNPRLRSDSSAALQLTAPNAVKKSKAERSADLAKRLQEVTADAIKAYNEILAKPNGLLSKVSQVGIATRRKNVKRCIATARDICSTAFGGTVITPKFWRAYFKDCAADPFLSGRKVGGNGHENWSPTFEYLTRPATMLKVFDKVTSK